MSSEFFPISFKDLGARIVPEHLRDGQRRLTAWKCPAFPTIIPAAVLVIPLPGTAAKLSIAPTTNWKFNRAICFLIWMTPARCGACPRRCCAWRRTPTCSSTTPSTTRTVHGKKELGALLLFFRHRSGHPGRREIPRAIPSRPRMHRPRRGRESGILPPPRGAARFPPENLRRPRRRGDEVLRGSWLDLGGGFRRRVLAISQIKRMRLTILQNKRRKRRTDFQMEFYTAPSIFVSFVCFC